MPLDMVSPVTTEANDEKIYKLVFGELQACTRPWLAELKEFVEK